ncbi:MAG: prolyl oligopeptidase family serine peptidase, partial [Verrucomicrobiota bacterium]
APAATPATRLPPAGIEIPAAARADLTTAAAALAADLASLRAELAARSNPELLELTPDAEIFHKAVDWALRHDEFFDLKQVAAAHRALATGRERVAALRRGEAPWRNATGLVVRGYRSRIDGSVQPYGLVIPPDLTPGRPRRLMVWLLGRGEKRTELAFIGERESGPPQLTPCDTVTLIPYGRFCNATKFAGETDVFEALAAVRTEQPIDPDRILVAGFSMGGASTWHLATHHAGLWAAAAPGAGFAETAAYAKVFAPGKEPPTAWEQKLWGWYDATAYARNLSHCPTLAYSGEIDPQKQAADVMAAALAQEGLTLPHLIGPGTAHKDHPEVRQDLTARLEARLDRGRDPRPALLRVTTRTLRYPGASWLRFEGLAEHWSRADLEGRLRGDTAEVTTRGTTAVRLVLPGLRTVKIDGQDVPLPAPAPETLLHRQDGVWRAGPPPAGPRKRPGLTGPVN